MHWVFATNVPARKALKSLDVCALGTRRAFQVAALIMQSSLRRTHRQNTRYSRRIFKRTTSSAISCHLRGRKESARALRSGFVRGFEYFVSGSIPGEHEDHSLGETRSSEPVEKLIQQEPHLIRELADGLSRLRSGSASVVWPAMIYAHFCGASTADREYR